MPHYHRVSSCRCNDTVWVLLLVDGPGLVLLIVTMLEKRVLKWLLSCHWPPLSLVIEPAARVNSTFADTVHCAPLHHPTVTATYDWHGVDSCCLALCYCWESPRLKPWPPAALPTPGRRSGQRPPRQRAATSLSSPSLTPSSHSGASHRQHYPCSHFWAPDLVAA
jgi:hypothetical protein